MHWSHRSMPIRAFWLFIAYLLDRCSSYIQKMHTNKLSTRYFQTPEKAAVSSLITPPTEYKLEVWDNRSPTTSAVDFESYPCLDFSVDTKNGRESLHCSLKHVARSIVDSWTCRDEDIEVDQIQGGITNLLFTLKCKRTEDVVIVRVFGEGSSLFIDRDVENIVFSSLSKRSVGPTFYGTFTNGRVEGYCHARSLSPSEMSDPRIFPRVATALSQLHAQVVKGINDDFSLWSKMKRFYDLAFAESKKEGATISTVLTDKLSLETMWQEKQWLKRELDTSLLLLEPLRNSDCGTLSDGFTDKGRNRLYQLGLALAMEKAFCHNDLLSGNILLDNHVSLASGTSASGEDAGDNSKNHHSSSNCNGGGSCSSSDSDDGIIERKNGDCAGISSTYNNNNDKPPVGDSSERPPQEDERLGELQLDLGGITLIDFEYAGYNSRAWDIANHFNEFAGFDFNIREEFPQSNSRRAFIRHYLRGVVAHTTFSTSSSSSSTTSGCSSLVRELANVIRSSSSSVGDDGNNGDDLDIVAEAFDSVVCKFTLASHLFWGTWAMVQSHVSSIDFDFEAYARLRYDGYYFHKEQFFCTK